MSGKEHNITLRRDEMRQMTASLLPYTLALFAASCWILSIPAACCCVACSSLFLKFLISSFCLWSTNQKSRARGFHTTWPKPVRILTTSATASFARDRSSLRKTNGVRRLLHFAVVFRDRVAPPIWSNVPEQRHYVPNRKHCTKMGHSAEGEGVLLRCDDIWRHSVHFGRVSYLC